MSKVTVRWEVEDDSKFHAAVGRVYPQITEVDLDEFDEDMSEEEILHIIEDHVIDDFNGRISWFIDNEDEAVRVVQAHFKRSS